MLKNGYLVAFPVHHSTPAVLAIVALAQQILEYAFHNVKLAHSPPSP
jgi:hypothetical protein